MKRICLSEFSQGAAGSSRDQQQPPPGASVETLQEVQRAVKGCQRCIVITGAGISVSSGIPDFRSPDGLFQQLKQKYPHAMSSGRDLFDATLFSDPGMVGLFYNFMGELRNLVSQANCTPTHAFIKELDDNGKLLRCYTQNIDSLEKRAGLETSFQKPPAATDTGVAAKKESGEEEDLLAERSDSEDSSGANQRQIPALTPDSSTSSLDAEDAAADAPTTHQQQPPPQRTLRRSNSAKRQRQRRQAALDKTFTKAVQLHGDLENVICTICHTKYPFTEKLAEEFCEGAPPPCPRCKEIEAIRDLVGKRSVATGFLRPDIVLYNETHPQGEIIGTLSEYDLRRRPDLLIVIGTSLRIPGVKRMVREMSRCVRACSLRAKRAGAGKSIFINRDEPPKGWEDVFDYFVSGDADQAISLLPIKDAEAEAGAEAKTEGEDECAQGSACGGGINPHIEAACTAQNAIKSIMSIHSICHPDSTQPKEQPKAAVVDAAAMPPCTRNQVSAVGAAPESDPAGASASTASSSHSPAADALSELRPSSPKKATRRTSKPASKPLPSLLSSGRRVGLPRHTTPKPKARKLTATMKVVKGTAAPTAAKKRAKKSHASAPSEKAGLQSSPLISSS